MKKLLLIGANSFVAKRIAAYFIKKKSEYALFGTFHNRMNADIPDDRQLKLDITDKKQVFDVLKKVKPDIIIITAAATAVVGPEDEAFRINMQGTANIVDAVKQQKLGYKIIFFSTDQVFDGKKGFYKETDKTNPVNGYGKSKLEAEKIVQDIPNHLILRFSYIFDSKQGDEKGNFITRFMESNNTPDNPYTVFSDFMRTFIYADDVPKVIDELIKKDYKGLINVTGNEYLSAPEMVMRIEKAFKIKKNYTLIKCNIPNVPAKLGLDNSLLKSIIKFKFTTFDEMLEKMKKEVK
jgi:dTDP-4-dehydrorhamnose reductase